MQCERSREMGSRKVDLQEKGNAVGELSQTVMEWEKL